MASAIFLAFAMVIVMTNVIYRLFIELNICYLELIYLLDMSEQFGMAFCFGGNEIHIGAEE